LREVEQKRVTSEETHEGNSFMQRKTNTTVAICVKKYTSKLMDHYAKVNFVSEKIV
jgi:hypothetical protein